jgi:hypothetical protein
MPGGTASFVSCIDCSNAPLALGRGPNALAGWRVQGLGDQRSGQQALKVLIGTGFV